ncbi:Lrp/AsnC family transcriptional regulator [Streptomyces sp. NPDC001076]
MTLDALDRRIVGALQIDGRAPWRLIADALGEPERTISRRGTALLESGTVVISGWETPGTASILSISGTAHTIRLTATALAHRPDTTFTYTLTGPADCVTEVCTAPGALPTLLHDDLPGTPGLVAMSTLPVMKYFRTGFQWHPDLLRPQEIEALRPFVPPPQSADSAPQALSSADRALAQAVAEDGRIPTDRLARLLGVAESTARRRLEALRRDGRLTIRAVVEPHHLGLGTEAVLWIKAGPHDVDRIGALLADDSRIRYAAAIMGEHQLFADIITRDRRELYDFVTTSPALATAHAVDTRLVVTSFKRSGVLAPLLRQQRAAPSGRPS